MNSTSIFRLLTSKGLSLEHKKSLAISLEILESNSGSLMEVFSIWTRMEVTVKKL